MKFRFSIVEHLWIKNHLHIELRGGVGNQFFTYFAGLHYAIATNRKLVIHDFGVDHERSIASFNLPGFFVRQGFFSGVALNFLWKHYISARPNLVMDLSKDSMFSDIDLDTSHFLLIRGFFQNPDYFHHITSKYPSLSELPFKNSEWCDRIIERINRERFNLIHLRRGDYLNYRDSLGVLDLAYFKNILESLAEEIPTYIISDDVEFASFAASDLGGTLLEDFSGSTLDFEYLCFFRHATNILTSNSSFSLLGALYAQNSSTIYVPDPWFKGRTNNISKLPGNWVNSTAIWETN
jgi:hypothetical protein